MLKNHSHIFPEFIYIQLRIQKLLSVYGDLSFLRFFQKVQAAQKCRFSGAGRTDDADTLTLVYVSCDSLLYVYVPEGLFQIFYINHFLSVSFQISSAEGSGTSRSDNT